MRHIAVLVTLAVLFTGSIAMAHPTPVPIPVTPNPPAPAPPGVTPTPAWVCVWIQLKGPGPFPFTPAPGQDIRDVEVDIPGDETLPLEDGFWPQPVLGEMGPFNDFQMIDMLFEPEYGVHLNVGHWYDGQVLMGNLIEVSNPTAGPDTTWYVHFTTPEPATLSLLALGGLALIRRRPK
jgi:hypothetical protein